MSDVVTDWAAFDAEIDRLAEPELRERLKRAYRLGHAAALLQVERLQAIRLHRDDVVVLRLREDRTGAAIEQALDAARLAFPTQGILVIEHGDDLAAYKPVEATS